MGRPKTTNPAREGKSIHIDAITYQKINDIRTKTELNISTIIRKAINYFVENVKIQKLI